MTVTRFNVLWIGVEPDPSLHRELIVRDHTFKHWKYDEFIADDKKVTKEICEAKAVFFLHNEEKPLRTIEFISCVGSLPVSYSGVLPYIFVKDPNSIPAILGNLGVKDIIARQPIPFIDISARPDYSLFAQKLACYKAGMAPKLDLDILGDTSLLDEVDRVLLKRSFSDCSSITVRGMPPGFSAKVITVFAEFGLQGQTMHSVPFIAKFDKKDDVEIELNNYKDYVNHFVPFNLRPGVDLSRCFYDQECGVIVANYVDRSTTLLDAITRGAGPAALHSLFEETMGRWLHNTKVEQTKDENKPPIYRMLQKGNPEGDRVDVGKFSERPQILKQAKKIAGPVLGPAKLLKAIEMIPCDCYLYGTCHKDLHAKNVLVRGSDAVIIDFPKCDKGPVLLDLATLDVSIAFDSVPAPTNKANTGKRTQSREEYKKKLDEWKVFVSDVFEKEILLSLPLQKNGHEPFAREWACIRQIRRLALSDRKCMNEYVICVAIELLRRSMFVDKGEHVAGYAYFITNRLVRSLSSHTESMSSK